MPKIKNPNYRKFLDKGMIDLIEIDHIESALKNVNGVYGKYINEGKALLIALYYTGARPNEVLQLVGKDIKTDGSYYTIDLKGSKNGYPRTIYISKKRRFITALYKYACSLFPDQFLFYHYIGHYRREYLDKKGNVKIHDDTDAKVRYYVNKWFIGVVNHSITPYYLRHSFFSKLSQNGASMEDIMMMKGARSIESGRAYVHMSQKTARSMARKIK